ncbi:MAG: hypothetical protein R3B48_01150 [Kofleriaceae bacterium]
MSDHQLGPDEDDLVLDELRRSMRELEAATPAGTFDALPAKVAARLDPAERSQEAPAPAPATAAAFERSTRAQRRSMLQTQVGAPIPWWQTRAAAVALGAVALVAAVALVVVRQLTAGGGASPLEASSAQLGDPRRGGAPTRGADARDVRPGAASEPPRLRAELSETLPVARGCLAARPVEPVALEVQVKSTGSVGAVAVRGSVDEPGAIDCLVEALRGAQVTPWPGDAVTVTLPLY